MEMEKKKTNKKIRKKRLSIVNHNINEILLEY